jgi:hypothetical protein
MGKCRRKFLQLQLSNVRFKAGKRVSVKRWERLRRPSEHLREGLWGDREREGERIF